MVSFFRRNGSEMPPRQGPVHRKEETGFCGKGTGCIQYTLASPLWAGSLWAFSWCNQEDSKLDRLLLLVLSPPCCLCSSSHRAYLPLLSPSLCHPHSLSSDSMCFYPHTPPSLSSEHPPSHISHVPSLLPPSFISLSRWWHLKPIRCLMCSRIGAEHGDIPPKRSEITEERQGCHEKQGSTLLHYYPDPQSNLYSRNVCVCVCVLVERGGLDNVYILQHKRPTGFLRIVWVILIATGGLQSQEPVVKYSIN